MPAGNGLTRLGIIASGACNLRCSYCRIARSAGSPPWTAVERALDSVLASRAAVVRVTFTGGEPLLALPLIRRCVSYVARAAERGPAVRYGLLTNGLLLTDAAVAFLVRHAFDVQVSLDGGREVVGRGGRATFDAVSAALHRLRHGHSRYFRDHVAVAATVTPDNVRVLADSVRFLLEQDVATIRLGAAMGTGSAPAHVRTLDRQFREVFAMMRRRFERTGRVPLEAFRKDLPIEPHARGAWFCGAVRGQALVVDADGTQAPCVMATRTYAPAPPRTFRPHLDAIGAQRGRVPPASRAARRRLRLFASDGPRYSRWTRCSECRWAAACTVCPLAAVQEPRWDDAFRVPDFLCAFSRTLLECRESFPAQAGSRVAGAGVSAPELSWTDDVRSG